MTVTLLKVFCGLFFFTLDGAIGLNSSPVEDYLRSTEIVEKRSGVENVDCLYVINLERRPEKWERIRIIFESEMLRPNRFDAIDGWTISENAKKELAGDYPVKMRSGEIGCLLSHLSVIQDALKRDFNVVWIFEDDVEFRESPHNVVALMQEVSVIDPDWDILYTDLDSKDQFGNTIFALGSDFRPDRQFIHPDDYYLAKTSVSKNLFQIRQRYGLYSYLISRKGMKKVCDYFLHAHLWTAIDIDIHYVPTLRQYTPKKDIVTIWCDSPYSDTKAILEQELEAGEKELLIF